MQRFGSGQVGGRIQIEEPIGGRAVLRIGELAGRKEKFDGENAERLMERCRGCLKCGKAAGSAGVELVLQRRQGGAVNDCGKGLGKVRQRRDGDCAAGRSSLPKQKSKQRGREEGKIDG